MNTVIIPITLLLCSVTVILNIGVILYYWPKVKHIDDNIVPFIYSLLSIGDLATRICAGSHTILFSIMLDMKESRLTSLWIIVSSWWLSVVVFKVSAYVSMIFTP